MSKFGWSYPPGCNGTPYDEDHPCDVCGYEAGACICPECPVCGSAGDPLCYKEHGLVLSPEQIENKRKMEEIWEAEASYEPDTWGDFWEDI